MALRLPGMPYPSMPCQLGLQLLMVLVGTSVGCGEEGYSANYYFLHS